MAKRASQPLPSHKAKRSPARKKGREDLASSQAAPAPALQRLAPLVGTWQIEGHTENPADVITGQTTIEWVQGGFFLSVRFALDFMGRKMSGLELVGYDASSDAFPSQVYSHGMVTSHQWDVRDGVVKIATRSAHYRGTLSDNDTKLAGHWEPKPGKASSSNLPYAAIMIKIAPTPVI
jgi:hypothetical protein